MRLPTSLSIDAHGPEDRASATAAGIPDTWIIFAFLAIPSLLFYAFIGKPILGAAFAVATLTAAPCFRLHADRARTAANGYGAVLTMACALAALALTTMGGEGRLVPATADWLIRDAVLRDLVQQAWPFVYHADRKDWVLRAPLGMYLIPAAIGKLAGLYGAHLALWLQNTLALCVVLRIFCNSASLARSVAVLVVFCIFSGWDVVGALALAAGHSLASGAPLILPYDIEWWAGLFQYSSTMTLVFWVPHHALGGWLFTALLLLWDRRRIRISALMIGGALAMFWSPFALMGAMPFLVKAGIEAIGQRRVAWSDVGVSVLLAIVLMPLVLYLTCAGGTVASGFQPLTAGFLGRYTVFVALEVLPFAAINHRFGDARGGFSRSTYAVAIASLVLIPFYKIGPSNDFVMRASIPALAILAVTTGHTACHALQTGGARILVIALVLVLGSLTGLTEIREILAARNNGISTCDLVQAWYQERPVNQWIGDSTYLTDQNNMPLLIRSDRPQVLSTGRTPARCVDQRL